MALVVSKRENCYNLQKPYDVNPPLHNTLPTTIQFYAGYTQKNWELAPLAASSEFPISTQYYEDFL